MRNGRGFDVRKVFVFAQKHRLLERLGQSLNRRADKPRGI